MINYKKMLSSSNSKLPPIVLSRKASLQKNTSISSLHSSQINQNVFKSTSSTPTDKKKHDFSRITTSPKQNNDDSIKSIILNKNEKSFNKISESQKKLISMMSASPKNKTLNKSIIEEETLEPKKLTYKIIKEGNDSSTIIKCFEHRINWAIADKDTPDNKVNFLWSHLQSKINFLEIPYDRNKIIFMCNHYENQSQLSNKLNMFKNLMIYCEENNLDLFCYVPMTILIEYGATNYIKQFKSFEYLFNNIEKFVSDSKPKEIKRKYRNFFYIDSNFDNKIGLKTNLYIQKTHYNGKNLWLLKAMNLNRGLAIKIVDSINDCQNYIRAFYQGEIFRCVKDSESNKDEEKMDANKKIYFELPKIVTSAKNENFKNNHDFCLYRQIDYYSLLKKSKKEKKSHYQANRILLQKYIEKPLLYHDRKFDIRIWVLITHEMKVYMFKEGHLKATSDKYSIENKNFFVHLTNYSVQKYSGNFSKIEVGNEISFDLFQKCLHEDYGYVQDVRKDIISKINDIITLSMKAVKKKINPNCKRGCFEIFGYDFMLDEMFNPYLIEINTNPGLEISSPLISKLVPRMIDDAFRLTIDKVFETEYSSNRYGPNGYISPFPVPGYSDNDNMFRLLVNLS